MKKIKILLANHPRMMREVVREMIEAQPDMEVVGEVLNPVELLVTVRETAADAVILGLEDAQELGVCSHLLAEYPNLTILALASTGKTAFIRPGRREIAEPSEAQILSALRHGIRSRWDRGEEIARD